MSFPIRIAICAPAFVLGLITLSHDAHAGFEKPANDGPEIHLAAAKNAAGGRDNTPDFYGLVTALCVAPQRGAPAPDAPAPRDEPDRQAAYMEPKRAFDDVYWMGT